ncbi:hypothetical protein GCM10020221_27370 [Streptomyces thioluteus]|uniref:Uncharacterized protein n=1 Tax=Streptomyces thioluteus TaxID=66431 RepID=A0ABN3WWZ3_STRTU
MVFDGAPTEKVKAPATGWLSAETACQATVYVPSAIPGRSATEAVSERPSVWTGFPASTRVPPGSSTRTESALSSTPSEKVSSIRAGAVGTTDP